jgi:hypothetical protein
MSLSLEPDLYQVSVDENGTYINKLPSPDSINSGIRCPCGSRRNIVFKTSTSLSKHFLCEKHKMWLKNLNLEKVNHYTELIKSREIVDQQQKLIKNLKLELQDKDKTIVNQAKELASIKKPIHVPVTNLLDL